MRGTADAANAGGQNQAIQNGASGKQILKAPVHDARAPGIGGVTEAEAPGSAAIDAAIIAKTVSPAGEPSMRANHATLRARFARF